MTGETRQLTPDAARSAAPPRAPARRPPRWLVGEWGPWIRDPLDLLRLALLAGAVVTAAVGPRAESVRLVLTFAVLLLPRFLDAPRPFDLAFIGGMYLQAWGNVFNVFADVYGYDKIVHFALPAGLSALLYLALIRLEIVPDLSAESGVHNRLAMVLLTFAFGFTVGGFYDTYEWFAIKVLGEGLFANYGDTIGDLTDDALGALLGGVLIVLWDQRGWGTRRRRFRSGAPPDPIAEAGDRFFKRIQPGAQGPPPEPVAAPRWLPVLTLIGDAIRASLLLGAGMALAAGHWEETVRFALSFAAALAPRLLRMPRPFDVLFCAAMAAQAWGDYATAFNDLTGFENVVRLLVAGSFGPIIYLGLIRLRAVPDFAEDVGIRHRTAIALTSFCFGYSVGILYELYIWVADRVLDADVMVTYTQLIQRMTLDGIGAVIGAALLVLWHSRGWGTTAGQRRSGRALSGASRAVPPP